MAAKMELDNLPADAVLSMSASILISAPASFVFDTFTTTDTWPEWNTFCPSVEAKNEQSEITNKLNVGTKMAVQVRMDPAYPESLRTQNMTVTDLSKPENENAGACYRVSWRAEGFPGFVLRANRTSECAAVNNGGGENICEFRTWEIMAGPAAYAVKYLYHSKLQARFEDTARDLKEYIEKLYASRG